MIFFHTTKELAFGSQSLTNANLLPLSRVKVLPVSTPSECYDLIRMKVAVIRWKFKRRDNSPLRFPNAGNTKSMLIR
jgi:hypothetical protein